MCDTWNWRSSVDFNCSLVELTSEMVPIGWGVFQSHDASQMIFYSCLRLQGLQDLQGSWHECSLSNDGIREIPIFPSP